MNLTYTTTIFGHKVHQCFKMLSKLKQNFTMQLFFCLLQSDFKSLFKQDDFIEHEDFVSVSSGKEGCHLLYGIC